MQISFGLRARRLEHWRWRKRLFSAIEKKLTHTELCAIHYLFKLVIMTVLGQLDEVSLFVMSR